VGAAGPVKINPDVHFDARMRGGERGEEVLQVSEVAERQVRYEKNPARFVEQVCGDERRVGVVGHVACEAGCAFADFLFQQDAKHRQNILF
jgi:hypothetical protein